jgi:5-deoxy-glucuronate isomerase
MSTPQILDKGWNSIDPSVAGWTYVSFGVQTLAAGESLTLPPNGQERAFVPLAGTAEASAAGQTWTFGGRPNVFAGLGHCLYLPRDTEVTLTASTDLEIAIAEAPATEKFAPVLVTPDDIDIELRGGGNASRQVGSLMLPGFPAERVYSPERDFDLTQTVRDGELLLIPWGYHTTVAAHGHDLYYLNVLAGPAPKRTLQAFQDPCLTATQDLWESVGLDSRLPFIPRYPDSHS